MADIEKIKSLLESVENMSASGFAVAFHVRLTSPDFLFQTYPEDWNAIYSEKGYVMVDPIVRWGFTELGSIRWSDLKDQDEHNILDQSLAYGMAYGAAVSLEADGTRSFAGCARPDREYTDAEIQELSGYIHELHSQTTSKTGMSDELRAELLALSIKMTHPSSGGPAT